MASLPVAPRKAASIIYGGAHPEKITAKHLNPEHLAKALCQAPITLQQYIEGSNIRTYAIAQQLFSVQLDSASIDFRSDRGMQVQVIETPAHIAAQVVRIMALLDLNGQYWFLEANPSPMFLGVQHQSGLPLCDSLIDAMTT